ncbi:GNAT family N-acetyltransferase [Cytobacillus sp. S13-E01]|uniref:GNAT family N-acetyltransferase n=1 Tax=Cytobacillus sp. S13-E01 TaxID=3031326 RepID=UPI0023D8AB33|nr:GNAT family N-acetyltransferase [Cytobacillus sp. S13-E01]MDF0728179.1 GNAT family N-acetyltransferase [Cytobacillus sp. S13-E01]
MLIRVPTNNEVSIIRSYAKIVQEEATVGYLKQTDDVPNMDSHFVGPSYYFVLLEKRNLCGWILVGETVDPFKNQPTGIILELYILSKHRKKGYGVELMKYALATLRNKGYNKVQLNVFSGNPAHKMYKKLGFKDVSTTMERKI